MDDRQNKRKTQGQKRTYDDRDGEKKTSLKLSGLGSTSVAIKGGVIGFL
jgi:hypothetical protein